MSPRLEIINLGPVTYREGPAHSCWVVSDIKSAIKKIKEAGRRPRQITLGRERLRHFLTELQIDFKFKGNANIQIFNALQSGREEAWLNSIGFKSYRGTPFRIVDGDQLTVE